MDQEESTKPRLKKLRNKVTIISERVSAVEKTCAEIKSSTVAELARLRKSIAKIEADQERQYGAVRSVRHRLDDLSAETSLQAGLRP
jgi:predicted  nucleic acid-binding Zn-ribbon protein